MWLGLVFPEPHLPVPASGPLAGSLLRDDPPTPAVHDVFRIDWQVFRHTLARLPAARAPWLREITENLTQHMRTGLL
ncbi:hypothetical protein SAMN05421806_11695 [Streptomyces indicus]|uniref:Uncharacterized protein n=1 Tax=Streptomyces indicus TaxID=417292 RepID=A0A1G9GMQ9_9ACTN|nr:hypothetical protein SAMN05421806_11695 [Streptomyces indicus]